MTFQVVRAAAATPASETTAPNTLTRLPHASHAVNGGKPLGEFLHLRHWERPHKHPAVAVTLTAPKADATPATAPVQPTTATAADPAELGLSGSTSGVSAAGVVTGRRTEVAPGASTETAASIGKFDGIAWAGLTAGNGNRDTTVLVPKGVDLRKPVEVITYFHGNGGSAAASTRELKSLVAQLPAHGRNAIIVIPTTPANKRDWMSPSKHESLTGLQDEAVQIAGQLTGRNVTVGSYTVEGFSGGGLPVATAAHAGELRASTINLFDSTYGDWGDATVKLRQPGATVNVFYTEHNRERASRLQGLPGVTLEPSKTNHGGTPGMYFFR